MVIVSSVYHVERKSKIHDIGTGSIKLLHRCSAVWRALVTDRPVWYSQQLSNLASHLQRLSLCQLAAVCV